MNDKLQMPDAPAPVANDPSVRTALGLVLTNPEQFRDDFREWLEENRHVWEAFEREASNLWALKRTHYSAYTIIEFIRHESAIREAGEGWKINCHYVPDLARLYALRYPERKDLFKFRVRTVATAA